MPQKNKIPAFPESCVVLPMAGFLTGDLLQKYQESKSLKTASK